MIRLTKEQVLMLHERLIQTTGGSLGIRDEGMLDSALSNPFQTFGGEELYPSIQAKAAQLCYGLVKNHSMIDGNKRHNKQEDSEEFDVSKLLKAVQKSPELKNALKQLLAE